MMRLVGALLVAGAAAGVGFSCVSRLRARARMLEELAGAMTWMARELEFHLTPTTRLFDALAQQSAPPVSAFFTYCRKEYARADGAPLSEAWRAAIEHELPLLREEERRILLELGGVLGRYDSEGQRAALLRTAERLGACAQSAGEEREKLGRVYGTLGLAVGAFLVILLY